MQNDLPSGSDNIRADEADVADVKIEYSSAPDSDNDIEQIKIPLPDAPDDVGEADAEIPDKASVEADVADAPADSVHKERAADDATENPDSDVREDAAADADSVDENDYIQLTLFDSDATSYEPASSPDLPLGSTEDEETDTDDEKYNPDKPRLIDTVFDFIELFIFSMVAVLLVTTFIFRHTVVEGSSMEQTLYEGEHLIISNLFYTPERGDIIVCVDYSTPLKKPIVKRIIGLEGDRVQVYSTGEVYINGDLLDEPYVYNDYFTPGRYVDTIVPEGELFVMGDHRNVSSDSRDIGTIDRDSVLGEVLFRFYPFDKFGKVESEE